MQTGNDATVIEAMLRETKNIAMVGVSDKHWRPSYPIGRYLIFHEYHVYPVNPELHLVFGRYVWPTLEVAGEVAHEETGRGIDLVNVYLASPLVDELVDEVIDLEIPYLWLQTGIRNDEAVERAREAGVQCVQDACIYHEHARRLGMREKSKHMHV